MAFLVGLLLLFTPYYQKEIQSRLSANQWRLYKTVEVLKNNQRTDTIVDQDTTIIKIGYKQFTSNFRGGNLDLNPDSTGRINYYNIIWCPIGNNQLVVQHDSSGNYRHNDFFRGTFNVTKLTDSSAILEKIIATNGNWIRTFHLKKTGRSKRMIEIANIPFKRFKGKHDAIKRIPILIIGIATIHSIRPL